MGMSALFTRESDTKEGLTVAENLAKKYMEYAKDKPYVKAMTFSHEEETPQNSLVVRIEGSEEPAKILIVGSRCPIMS